MAWNRQESLQEWGFYWVDAFVVPVRENNQTIGYMSVRKEPNRQQITAGSRHATEMAEHIANAAIEQSAATEDVARNMEQMSALIEKIMQVLSTLAKPLTIWLERQANCANLSGILMRWPELIFLCSRPCSGR